MLYRPASKHRFREIYQQPARPAALGILRTQCRPAGDDDWQAAEAAALTVAIDTRQPLPYTVNRLTAPVRSTTAPISFLAKQLVSGNSHQHRATPAAGVASGRPSCFIQHSPALAVAAALAAAGSQSPAATLVSVRLVSGPARAESSSNVHSAAQGARKPQTKQQSGTNPNRPWQSEAHVIGPGSHSHRPETVCDTRDRSQTPQDGNNRHQRTGTI